MSEPNQTLTIAYRGVRSEDAHVSFCRAIINHIFCLLIWGTCWDVVLPARCCIGCLHCMTNKQSSHQILIFKVRLLLHWYRVVLSWQKQTVKVEWRCTGTKYYREETKVSGWAYKESDSKHWFILTISSFSCLNLIKSYGGGKWKTFKLCTNGSFWKVLSNLFCCFGKRIYVAQVTAGM